MSTLNFVCRLILYEIYVGVFAKIKLQLLCLFVSIATMHGYMMPSVRLFRKLDRARSIFLYFIYTSQVVKLRENLSLKKNLQIENYIVIINNIIYV